MTPEEILDILDAQCEMVHHDPPHLYQLWTHFYPADTRLTVFRSSNDWAIFFEIFGYWCRGQCVQSDIWAYGSGSQGQSMRYSAAPLVLLDDQTGEPLGSGSRVNPRRFSVLWSDQRYDFTPSPEDYDEAGIAFDPHRPDPDAHQTAQIVRYLCERLDHPFFLPEEELREIIAQGGNADATPEADTMSLFLQTRAWRHPDLGTDERPSQLPGFQTLARAIVSGDLSEWDQLPPSSFNTDWRVYDWAEKEEEQQRQVWEAKQNDAWEALPLDLRQRLHQEAATHGQSI